MRLRGQVAWITGAAQGLGQALAHRLAHEGCSGLALSDVQTEKLQAVAEAVHNQYPHCETLALPCDVRREPEVQHTTQQIAQRFGKLDILIANAGVIHSAELTEMSLEQWQWQLDVNLTGYFLCAREAAKLMQAQGTGVILQINSKSGLKGSYKNAAYAASKFGGIGLTQSIAMDLAPYGIRVNAICPGNLLDSPMWQGTLFEQYARKWGLPEDAIRRYYEAQTPLGRGCAYEDVANLVVFLASDEASYITGEAYRVAGGQL
ncbi:MAG: sorbitol 6-phosphate dehydrogenase [Fimbriimonadales bacterium]|nr:MAG: sorbitol 6-phosphate dehydrogenase [Fimbriimonadales bacterium]GIV11397.1 MAG: sorbitol 6-phosphate dehydrogenase [Fimbriimonadales bacterium]